MCNHFLIWQQCKFTKLRAHSWGLHKYDKRHELHTRWKLDKINFFWSHWYNTRHQSHYILQERKCWFFLKFGPFEFYVNQLYNPTWLQIHSTCFYWFMHIDSLWSRAFEFILIWSWNSYTSLLFHRMEQMYTYVFRFFMCLILESLF
jgi:hypothetical protein